MTFATAFRILVYATVAWAFTILASSAELHVAAAPLFIAAVAASMLRRRLGLRLPGFAWLVLNLGVFCGALYSWFWLQEKMYAVIYLFLYLEANKLLTASRNRDYVQVLALTFFQVLASAVSTTSVLFAPALVIYVFLGVAALVALTTKRDAEAALGLGGGAPKPDPARPHRLTGHDRTRLARLGVSPYIGWRGAAWTWVGTVAVACMGTVLFFTIPRIASRQFFAGVGTQTRRVSGFGDSVLFGGVGDIQTDATIVARVEPDGYGGRQPFPFLRLRGASMDRYSGRSWTLGNAQMNSAISLYGWNFAAPPRDRPFLTGVVTLEPSDSGYVFLPSDPVSVNFGRREVPIRVGRDGLTTTQLRPPAQPIRYSFGADPRGSEHRRDAPGSQEPPPRTIADGSRRVLRALGEAAGTLATTFTGAPARNEARNADYLQLDEASPDTATIRSLAGDWTGGLSDREEIATEIERHLKSEYRYSLDISFSSLPDHLRRFLTVERAGHCEYFATAMALMLRARGIPSRVVNGYLTDEWSDAGKGMYLVRQEHAHSWVEALTGESSGRWSTFDPTPDGGIGSARIQPTLYHTWSRWVDSLKIIWYDAVVDYSGAEQQAYLAAMARWSIRAWRHRPSPGEWKLVPRTPEERRTFLGQVLVAAGLLLGVSAVLGLARGARRRAEARGRPAGARSGVRIEEYLALLAAVEKRHARRPSWTPREYAGRAVGVVEGIADFLPLTELYYGARFDGAAWSAEATDRAAALRRALDAPRR